MDLINQEDTSKKKQSKKELQGVRTKDVFGKKLGKTNIIILLILVVGIVFVSRYFILKSVTDEQAKVASQIKQTEDEHNAYLTAIKNQSQAEFEIGEISTSLPSQFSYTRTVDDIEDSLWLAGVNSDDFDYSLSYVEVASSPVSNVSEYVRSVRLSLTVTLPNLDYVKTFTTSMFNEIKIYYFDEYRVQVNTSDVTLNIVFYTFYETVEG